MKYANKINREIKVFNSLPNLWNDIIGFQYIDKPHEYGFYPIEEQTLPDGKVFGDLYFTGSTFKYELVDAPPKPVPQTISNLDLRLNMYQMYGISPDSIDAMIEQMANPDKTISKQLWNKAVYFERQHPVLIEIAQALGITDTQLDELFKNQ